MIVCLFAHRQAEYLRSRLDRLARELDERGLLLRRSHLLGREEVVTLHRHAIWAVSTPRALRGCVVDRFVVIPTSGGLSEDVIDSMRASMACRPGASLVFDETPSTLLDLVLTLSKNPALAG